MALKSGCEENEFYPGPVSLLGLREARNNRNAGMFICIIDCCLSCVEWLLTMFNKYAFVYVSIYGYDFKTAGSAVWKLFTEQGFVPIINDDIIDTALSFGCLGSGVITGFVGYAYGAGAGVSDEYKLVMFVIGLVAG